MYFNNLLPYIKFVLKVSVVVPVIIRGVISLWESVQKELDSP